MNLSLERLVDLFRNYFLWFAMAFLCVPPGFAETKENALMRFPAQEPSVRAQNRLVKAVQNPEYLLSHWIRLPVAPKLNPSNPLHLSLKEAILLALRYNPNIQNAELDRVIQRYQLRLAENEFELQYALAGSGMVQRTEYTNLGKINTYNYIATPVFNIKNTMGTQASLTMDNRLAIGGAYTPLLNFNLTQPLLRGFGQAVNQASILSAKDNEFLSKLALRQYISNQITHVMMVYRSMVLSANNLTNTQFQLKEAQSFYESNQKRIAAGELESSANIQQSYQVESLKIMAEQAHYDFELAAQELLQSIGLSPETNVAVPSDLHFNWVPLAPLSQVIRKALAHNLQYVSLKKNLAADQRAYILAKNQQLWQLDLTGNVQLGNVAGPETASISNQIKNIYKGQNISESAGLRLTIPLNDLNRHNQLITAKIRLEKDKINLVAAKRTLIMTIKNIFNSIDSQAKRYHLAKRQRALAAESYKIEKQKQEAGISSALDVSNTQNQLISASLSLISAKVSYLNQVAILQEFIGSTIDDWKLNLRFGG